MPDPLEQMDKGGRLNPDLPHVFAPSSVDTYETGGIAARSNRCAVCGGSKLLPVHSGVGGSVAAARERHGPWGQ